MRCEALIPEAGQDALPRGRKFGRELQHCHQPLSHRVRLHSKKFAPQSWKCLAEHTDLRQTQFSLMKMSREGS